MATTTLLQHPRHDQHPLEPRDFSKDSIRHVCDLCNWQISADGYACLECMFYAHRVCAEAPPRIDLHPFHTDHPLTLTYRRLPFISYVCDLCDGSHSSFFGCDECDFSLDIRCALSTLSDRGGSQGKTPENIILPLHPHTLTSFSTRHDFIGDSNCVICKASVKEDGYACLNWQCEFLIHKRCIQDLYYTDGTKAPQVYHGHPLETFLGEDTGSGRCQNCGSKASSGEFIGCVRCEVFIHRDCFKVPEIIQYPHHPDHNLALLINSPDNDGPFCDSCLVSLDNELCYGCASCEFFVDMRCALQVLDYCEKGMSAEIKLSWHEHPLHLCLRNKDDSFYCSCCENVSAGPMYTCKEEGCRILLHKGCTEIESTIIFRYHLDHPLTLHQGDDFRSCEACCETIFHLYFSCELCAFNLHPKCTSCFPTRKHPLHEHELLHLKKAPLKKCNRCKTRIDSPFFRCVLCNFNLHEECMELPLRVVNSKVHWHSLTLHETYIEDDSGEYFCDKCEKRRDHRLGVYVCLQCPGRWAYHIECIFPELLKVFVKEHNAAEIERLERDIMERDITEREEEVCKAERKLEAMKRELEEQKKKHAALTAQ